MRPLGQTADQKQKNHNGQGDQQPLNLMQVQKENRSFGGFAGLNSIHDGTGIDRIRIARLGKQTNRQRAAFWWRACGATMISDAFLKAFA
ncbi:hypothetical protein ACFMPD_12310 [Sedimentitalea sp. HM32M-2]|uniref:hypothetical protein n=1 Tax=Sedimentitalea sp. HM32M-2 TaxID=3351566 RepID=UPI003637A998